VRQRKSTAYATAIAWMRVVVDHGRSVLRPGNSHSTEAAVT
jgi:hypothetical protein